MIKSSIILLLANCLAPRVSSLHIPPNLIKMTTNKPKGIQSFFTSTKPALKDTMSSQDADISGLKRSRDNDCDDKSIAQVDKAPKIIASENSCTSSNVDVNVNVLINNDWNDHFKTEFAKPYFKSLMAFVASERAKYTVYPPIDEVYSAFELCPFNKVRVVIIGQDPYHGPGQAHGLAFSVKKGVDIPPSLKNVYKEAQVYLYK